ncbi:MAG TPA: hypothetical protein VK833_09710 [Gillisia sp.]|nr:hypothetical protein [Gillisia sp.]
MKTLLIIISIAGLITLNSCENKSETDVNAMLEDPETRDEIFTGIVDDSDRMTSFMEYMQENDHAMQMMQNNKMMMGNMMQDGGMQMMMNDRAMMNNMMQMMMNDGTMMGNMMQMMYKNGMMNDECMETMKNMMTEKGMNMNTMGNMHNN